MITCFRSIYEIHSTIIWGIWSEICMHNILYKMPLQLAKMENDCLHLDIRDVISLRCYMLYALASLMIDRKEWRNKVEIRQYAVWKTKIWRPREEMISVLGKWCVIAMLTLEMFSNFELLQISEIRKFTSSRSTLFNKITCILCLRG